MIGAVSVWAYQEVNRLRPRSYEYDNNEDRRPDELWFYKKGYPIKITIDRNFDAKPDYWEFYERGLVARGESDDNFDGRIDSWFVYSNGNFARWEQDKDFNGKPDVTYAFSDGITKEGVWKPNGATNVFLREVFKNGVLIEEWRDWDRDGQFDISIKFDPFLNPIETNYLPSIPKSAR